MPLQSEQASRSSALVSPPVPKWSSRAESLEFMHACQFSAHSHLFIWTGTQSMTWHCPYSGMDFPSQLNHLRKPLTGLPTGHPNLEDSSLQLLSQVICPWQPNHSWRCWFSTISLPPFSPCNLNVLTDFSHRINSLGPLKPSITNWVTSGNGSLWNQLWSSKAKVMTLKHLVPLLS